MPSLGSLPFSPPAPSGGSSALLQRRIALKKPPFSLLYGRNGLECEMRPLEVLKAGILKKSVRAAGRSGAIEGKGEGSSGDDENYGTDYIEEMFEDGKEVLRTQSEILDKRMANNMGNNSNYGNGNGNGGSQRSKEDAILIAVEARARQKLIPYVLGNSITEGEKINQILERKRLLSAVIDDTRSEAESNSLTNNEVGKSSEDICKMMISEEIHRKHSSDPHSEISNSVNQIDASGPLYRERAQNSQFYEAMAGDLGLLREAGSAGAYPDIVSPSLSKLSSLNGIKPQVYRDCKETYVEDVKAKWDATHEEVVKDATPLAGDNVMNIILVAAECAPWSKTGGLGDVAGALPKALARRGHRVMVVVPKYGNYSEPQNLGVYRKYKVEGQDMEVSYFHVYVDGVDFVFIDSPPFRHRENDIYGGNHMDVLKRMVLLCKAAVEVPWHVPCGGVCYGDGNLVFIANDWHTALLPVYLKAYYREHGQMMYTRCVLVIHNIAHQGRGPLEYFRYLDLPDHYIDLFKLYDPLGGEHLNIFAAGLKAADRLLTVSHGYAWEIKTSEGGWGLNRIINDNDWKFQGIVNGIDTRDWNPNLDVHLKSDGYSNYSLETLKIGKPRCKAALQRELGLPVRDDIPVIGFIGRLDHQKGVDLIGDAMHWIMAQDVQLIMLGTGQHDLEEMLRKFEREHYDKVRGRVEFSVKIAHRITAGADILLMPSRFEPCGLNQLYAMMYGTIPVVHAVGGLRDTVHQFDPYNESGFGWTFDRAEASKLIDALGNACNTYWNYKESWEGLQRRGMMQDLSWDNAAQQYENVLVAAKYQW